MKLMTAEALIKHAGKYKVEIYAKNGELLCNIPNYNVITPALKSLLKIHRDKLRSHFGV